MKLTIVERRSLSTRWAWLLLTVLFCCTGTVERASALVRFDFEQAYYVHPGTQTWDFCVVRTDSTYHIFYTAIKEEDSHSSHADTLWHGSSPDLKHWEIVGPALAVGPDAYDSGALWAPEVVWDETEARWAMLYTGADGSMNQRICLAYSDDLETWTKSADNPVLEPDPAEYIWNPEGSWSDFRDPYLYRENDQWHVLVTAKKIIDQQSTGVLFHGVSDDLHSWTDVGYLFANDGVSPWRVPESPQYFERNGQYHLLFGEFDTVGTSHLDSETPAEFSMDSREIMDYGYAPEVDQFDPDVNIFSRLGNYEIPGYPYLVYVVRFDTLLVSADGTNLSVYRPHPLDEQWEYRSGLANYGNPTFGENPTFRGDSGVGVVGNSYYGSYEYYQGPLSGVGQPGTFLGNAAKGVLKSYPFVITGEYMDLLVGGGEYPETCYVALVDAQTDQILFSETGHGRERMTARRWRLRQFNGRLVYITIVDQETGAMGHINVDEIIESGTVVSGVSDLPAGDAIVSLGAAPNPFNPATTIRFLAELETTVTVRVLDLKGREMWLSPPLRTELGVNSIRWNGRDQQDRPLAAGIYLFTVESAGRVAASGKLTLVK